MGNDGHLSSRCQGAAPRQIHSSEEDLWATAAAISKVPACTRAGYRGVLDMTGTRAGAGAAVYPKKAARQKSRGLQPDDNDADEVRSQLLWCLCRYVMNGHIPTKFV